MSLIPTAMDKPERKVNRTYKGIIVVWCGNLHITEDEDGHPTNFNGIVVSLKGDGDPLPVDPDWLLPATNCTGVTNTAR